MPRTASPRRRDAAENRCKLVAAAGAVFAERGLDAPLDEIARRAGVSIGTLYNNFPARDALIDAVVPDKLAASIELGEQALAEPDPWQGFVRYVEGMCERQVADRGLNDILSRRYPDAADAEHACGDAFTQVGELIARAQRAGRMRADFTGEDFAYIIWSTARIIDATRTIAPHSWRRHISFLLDGLRAEAATPVAEPPLTPEQLYQAMLGAARS